MIGEIMRDKKVGDVEDIKALIKGEPLNFLEAISGDGIRIIAEIKRASPTKGILREDFDPVYLASEYIKGGASAISVITQEKFFLGRKEYIRMIKERFRVPVLRKDFITTEYEVYESRALGSDSLLLISSILDERRLKRLLELSRELSMEPVVEVHDEGDVKKALSCGAKIMGINSRNLKTLEVDMDRAEKLLPLIPKGILIIAESGIKGKEDIERFLRLGIRVFLIGEALVRSEKPSERLKEWL